MTKKRAPRRARQDGRNANGRFMPGYSGNLSGRPRREPEEPKLLDELIAEKLLEKAQVTGPDGKRRKVSALERIVEGLVDSLVTAKPREKMQILEQLEKRSLFHLMRLMADDDCQNPFDDQHETWLEDRLMAAEWKSIARRYKLGRQKARSDVEHDLGVIGSPRR